MPLNVPPRKLGRNEPCFCGSGRKYKKCHGYPLVQSATRRPDPQQIQSAAKALERLKATQLERELQHGLGRPPISAEFNGQRVVAVGSQMLASAKWKTFPDFLLDYLPRVMGQEWGAAQNARPAEEHHPIVKWYELTRQYQNSTSTGTGEVINVKANGAVTGTLWVAYGLYLLQHNAAVQKRLLERLRSDDEVQIFGALYEVWVAATMVWAGFELTLEDESDGTETHCEFTAVSKQSGRSYSVEAKVCDPGNITGSAGSDRSIRRQLARAVSKRAAHARIAFIDLNTPQPPPGRDGVEWLESRARAMRRQERTIKDAPPAAVYLTNFPFRYHLDEFAIPRHGILEGFKLPKLKFDAPFFSLRELSDFRAENADLAKLQNALRTMQIPSTLDGQLPSRVFGPATDRVLIGERYSIPMPDGSSAIGELVQALVNEPTKKIVALLRMEDGTFAHSTMPISDAELSAYRESPDTFFGVVRPVSKELKEPIELYEFFLKSYRNTPKEKLLGMLTGHSDYEHLKQLSQLDLVKLYCERSTLTVVGRSHEKAPPKWG